MAFICAFSFFLWTSWFTYKERKNLIEKGLRLELVSNTTVVDINSMLLSEKTFEGNYACGFNVQIKE